MQKLNRLLKCIGNESGSSLVSTVAISALLGIASVGYLQLTGSHVSQEVLCYDDCRAFQAAESGLLVGSGWLKMSSNYSTVAGLSDGGTIADIIPSMQINGYSVNVDLKKVSGNTLLTATAQSSARIGYNKTVSWKIAISTKPSGAYGTFVNNLMSFNGGNTQGIRKLFFDGPVRANTALRIFNGSPGNRPEFDGAVSLYNMDPVTNSPVVDSAYGTGHFNNDYTHGLSVAAGGRSSSDFDAMFDNVYNPAASRSVLKFNSNGAAAIDLTASSNKSFSFGVSAGTPYYSYYNSSNVLQTIQYSAANPLIVHISGSAVSVSGTVKGQVTLFTDQGKMITISDDLLYDGYSPPNNLSITDSGSNFGLGLSSKNVIALVSGSNISIDNNSVNTICGQLFACSSDTSSISFTVNKKNNGVNLIGTRCVSGFWDNKQGNDQVAFNNYFDRRQLSAPGLGYSDITAHGDTANALVCSGWTEKNQ